ncbi:MAG: CvpA family protein [Planctomycetaceae bacterium]|nr:CvpA family protein [Planctomycetaceae bacterium]
MITLYDALMLLILFVGVIQGAWRGMAWQIAPIASLILGYIISYPLSVSMAQYFGKPPLNRLWAMIAIYLVVSLFVYMVARSIRQSLEKLKLIEFDRHLGALLGGVKALLFSVALTMGLITVSDQARDVILKSESSTIAARFMNTISPILPEQLNALVHPYVKNLNDQLPEIADNPTFTLPVPPVLIPNRIANQDRLAKPSRFGDEEPEPLPPSRRQDEDVFDFPEPAPRSGSNIRPPSRSSRPPASNPAPSLFDDEFAPPLPTRNENAPSRERLPPTPPEDDFFNAADPDKALPGTKPGPR